MYIEGSMEDSVTCTQKQAGIWMKSQPRRNRSMDTAPSYMLFRHWHCPHTTHEQCQCVWYIAILRIQNMRDTSILGLGNSPLQTTRKWKKGTAWLFYIPADITQCWVNFTLCIADGDPPSNLIDYDKQEFFFNGLRDERITQLRQRICYNQTIFDDLRLEATEYAGLTLEVQDLVARGGPTTALTEVDNEHTTFRIIDNDGRFAVEICYLYYNLFQWKILC